MADFAFPPRADWRILVSLESRNGINSDPEDSLLMTLQRENSDLLMFPASLSLIPSALVSLALSDPAKSTRFWILQRTKGLDEYNSHY